MGYRSAPYTFFILLLSSLALLLLGFEILVRPGQEVLKAVAIIDTAICAVFFCDFLFNLARGTDRRRYFFTWGWLDLLSSVPIASELRWGRTSHVVRAIRLLRAARACRELVHASLQLRARKVALGSILAGFLLLSFSSISILYLEEGENIQTAEQAVWWSFVTLSTVGYGDFYPVSSEGRILAALLMFTGIGLFGTFTSLISNWLLSTKTEQRQTELADIYAELKNLQQAIERIEARLEH